MRTIVLLLSNLFILLSSLQAQSPVTGTVSDAKTDEALPYTIVRNLSTGLAVPTDMQGKFTIGTQTAIDTLEFSMIGYNTLKTTASGNLTIKLNTSTLALSEIVVSANREQELRKEAPMAISGISTSTLEDNKPTTIDQVLNQTPGVYMVDLGNEQHTMSIRRPIDYGASYLYMEDGLPIRTSGVFNHNALIEINMANVNKIEIIRGPASNIYGSEAIGGAVNFISQKPSLKPTAGISIQGNNIGYKRTDIYASNTFKKFGIRVSGYYADKKGGILEYSDFNKLAMSLYANYFVNENNEVAFSTDYINYYSEMSGSLDSADFYSKSYGSNQTFTNRQVDAFRSKLSFNHYWYNRSKTSVTGFFRNNSVKQNPSYRVKDDYKPWSRTGDPNLAHGEVNDNGFNSYGSVIQHKQDFEWLNSSLIGGLSLDYSPNTYQANYIRINKNQYGKYSSFEKTDSSLANYTANLLNTATYIQGQISPVKRLNLVGCLRFDHFNYQFDNHLDSNAYTAVLDGKNAFSRVTPKIGATYDLKKNRGIYANYGQGFVPPQVGDLYKGNKVPLLKPVYFKNYEAGGWITFAHKHAKLDISFYQMDGLNEIVSVLQNDGSTVRQNSGKTRHKGIEYGLQIQVIKDLSIKLSGTNASHKYLNFDESGVDFSGNSMAQSPNWIANAVAMYKPSWIKGFRIGLEWQHIDQYYMDNTNTIEYPGYDIFNIRLGYEHKSFEIWTNILNATNQLYATVASASVWGQTYSLGNPRNINIGIAYKFKKQ